MGNCIHSTSKHTLHPEKIRSQEKTEAETEKHGNGRTRVKIVLKKEELELLLLQLKKTDGRRPLEDVLEEIQRCRAKAAAWRPCLDTILETQTPPLLPLEINP